MRTELELEVRARWLRWARVVPRRPLRQDRTLCAALAVYSDQLQQVGDPRGELIALDLRADRTDAVLRRRRELERAWLGGLAEHPGVSTHLGLIGLTIADGDRTDHFEPALSRFADHVESVRLLGAPRAISNGFELLARAPRPWLARLWIRADGASPQPAPLITDAEVAALDRAAPSLHDLRLSSACLVDGFPHPGVCILTLDGAAPIHVGSSEPGFAGVSLLAVACLGPLGPGVTTSQLVELLSRSRFPAVRTLDLQRDEPPPRMRALALGGELHVFAALHDASIAAQLRTLRLPAVRTDDQARTLQRALDRMSELETLELSGYDPELGLRHATARISVAPPRPWIARSDPAARTELILEVPALGAFPVQLEETIGWLEKSFDELPRPAQAGWEAFWDAARAVLSGRAGTASLGLTGFRHAVLALADKLVSPGWYRLVRALAARAVGRDEPDLQVIVRVE